MALCFFCEKIFDQYLCSMKRQTRFEKPKGLALKKLERSVEQAEKEAIKKDIQQLKSGTASKATQLRMKQDYIAYVIGFSGLLLLAGVLLLVFYVAYTPGKTSYDAFRQKRHLILGTAFLLIGIVSLVTAISRYRKKQFYKEDPEEKEKSAFASEIKGIPEATLKQLDFDAMLELFKKEKDQKINHLLFNKLFALEDWCFILPNIEDLQNAKPSLAQVGNISWIMVFTDSSKAQQFGKSKEGFHDQIGNVFFLKMKTSAALEYVERSAEKGITGIMINPGKNHWCVLATDLSAAYRELGKTSAH
jgi:hypothetical protein